MSILLCDAALHFLGKDRWRADGLKANHLYVQPREMNEWIEVTVTGSRNQGVN